MLLGKDSLKLFNIFCIKKEGHAHPSLRTEIGEKEYVTYIIKKILAWEFKDWEMKPDIRENKQQRKGGILRKNLIALCLTFPGVYENYPFGDESAAMRHGGNQRILALFLKHGGRELLNLKSEPLNALFWRNELIESVIINRQRV